MSNTVLCVIVFIALIYALASSMPQTSCNKNRYKYTPTSDITIRWFHRPGCPHCDNMKSDWIRLKNSGLPTKYKFVDVDTSIIENKKLAEHYDVNGVPHIVKCLSNGYFQVYNGDRSMEHMRKWVLSK